MKSLIVEVIYLLPFVFILANCYKDFSIRLVDGISEHEGHVEIYYKKEWRSICDDRWDLRDAKVVCRQLGYGRALNATTNSFFQKTNSTDYWLDNLDCWGSERKLHLCKHAGLSDHNCVSDEQAGVVCSVDTDKDILVPVPYTGEDGLYVPMYTEIRLLGPKEDGFISRGYVEVFSNGEWSQVCKDRWTAKDSYVACGELGYPDGEEENPDSNSIVTYQTSPSYIKIECAGVESKLVECPQKDWRKEKCKSDEAVWLTCKRSPFIRDGMFDLKRIQEYDVRLRSGYTYSEGRVELLMNGTWGTICDDGWDIQDANVICRQVGFGTAKEALHNARFGYGVDKIWFDEVHCQGLEKDIRDCVRRGYNVADCGHAEDASVKCHAPHTGQQAVRLSGGSSKSIGKVEVFKDNKWYGVCGVNFDLHAAEVICRQLGLGYAGRAFSSTQFGTVNTFALGNVKCSGKEFSFDDCSHDGWMKARCHYYNVASVECAQTAPDIVVDIPYLQSSIYMDVRYLASLSCAHEEKCLGSTATYQMNWPHLFTRKLVRFSTKAWNRGTANFRPSLPIGRWQFHMCHNHYHSMERFSDYDLLNSEGTKVAEGHKASFCLEDSTCDKGVAKVFNCTNRGAQGIAVNCGDAYKSNIDCQWIDVTGVPDSNYTLRVIVNAKRKIVESDYSNNAIACQVSIIGEKVYVYDCNYEICEHRSYGGTGNGGCCEFPFIYKGKPYHQCTGTGFSSLWCSTTPNYDVDKKWGFC